MAAASLRLKTPLTETTMNQIIHSMSKFTFAAFVLAAFSLNSFAQPTPANPGPSPSHGPGIGGPVVSPSGSPVPMGMPMPQSIISADESKTYTAFQQQINEDPAIKDLHAKIAKLTKEIQQLRLEANAAREKLIASNPEIKKIQDKITAAMQTRAPNGAAPMPLPVPNKTK